MPKFRTLTGQFVAYIPDGPDPDITPDRLPMSGRALFTPIYTGGVIGFPGYVPPEFARPEPIPALVIDGEVRIQVGGGDFEEPTTQPLSLMVTVDDEATQVWSWKVDFSDMQIAGRDDYVTVPSMTFRIPEGDDTIDLSELVPVGAKVGGDIAKGPRGAGLQTITAVDGQLVFTYTDSQQFTIPVPEAVQGPVGPEGPQGPAGLDGAEGPQGPKGEPGEIPELLVGNIADATPVGRALVRATTEGAARSTLGLAAGATAINGALSELENGVSNNPRVWTPANIANYTSAKIVAAVNDAKTVVNVKDYGAVGDGTTDNSPAVQSALTALGNAGGGTLMFPPGVYHMSTAARLVSNITITGTGATLKKLPASAEYAFFSATSDHGTGYGGSVSNVTCRDISFQGTIGETAATSRTACAFALHHASGVLVENCRFTACAGGGHRLDLQGCERVTVRGCTFEGFNDVWGGSSLYDEDIQLDHSTRFGGSATGDSNWDGLPCRDITVENNRWVPWFSPELDRAFPAPIAVGSHSAVDGMWHSNIRITGNVIQSPVLSPSAVYSGAIHFTSWRNVVIEGNTFDGGGSDMHPITIVGSTQGAALSSVSGATYDPVTLSADQMCDNVKIANNTFTRCAASSAQARGLVSVSRSGTTFTGWHTNISVTGNTFSNNKIDGDPSVNNGLHAVLAERVRDLEVSGNTAIMTRRLLYAVGCVRVSVSGNSITDAVSAFCYVDGCSTLGISDNLVSGYCGSPALLVQGTSGAKVSGNQIAVSAGAIVAVRVKDCVRPQVLNNLVESVNSTDFGSTGSPFNRAVELSGTTANAVVSGNLMVRASTGVDELSPATSAVNDRNTLL